MPSAFNLSASIFSCQCSTLLTILSQIFRLPSLEQQVYKADGLAFLPPFLTPDFSVRRTQVKEDLVELLVTDLGDASHKAPYLVVSDTQGTRIPGC